jgi:hypothetical protein
MKREVNLVAAAGPADGTRICFSGHIAETTRKYVALQPRGIADTWMKKQHCVCAFDHDPRPWARQTIFSAFADTCQNSPSLHWLSSLYSAILPVLGLKALQWRTKYCGVVWFRIVCAPAWMVARTHGATCWRRGPWERVPCELQSGARGTSTTCRPFEGCTVYAGLSPFGGVHLRCVRRRRVPMEPVLMSNVAPTVSAGKGPKVTALGVSGDVLANVVHEGAPAEVGQGVARSFGPGPAKQQSEVDLGTLCGRLWYQGLVETDDLAWQAGT